MIVWWFSNDALFGDENNDVLVGGDGADTLIVVQEMIVLMGQ